MPPQKMLFIVNPAAKHGLTSKMLPSLQRLVQGVIGVEVEVSAGPFHAHDIAAQSTGFDTIVAVGGDGTVHEVINGVMANPSRPAFGVIPTGSGNDYARTLGMSTDLTTAMGQLVSAPVKRLDLGLCNDVWFAESLAIGLDARVTARAVQLKLTSKMTGIPLYLKALLGVQSAPRRHERRLSLRQGHDPVRR
ncbi:MAG: diacylglycerol/lipid kinase family protein [Coriobacteriia bacterium]